MSTPSDLLTEETRLLQQSLEQLPSMERGDEESEDPSGLPDIAPACQGCVELVKQLQIANAKIKDLSRLHEESRSQIQQLINEVRRAHERIDQLESKDNNAIKKIFSKLAEAFKGFAEFVTTKVIPKIKDGPENFVSNSQYIGRTLAKGLENGSKNLQDHSHAAQDYMKDKAWGAVGRAAGAVQAAAGVGGNIAQVLQQKSERLYKDAEGLQQQVQAPRNSRPRS